VAKDDLRAKLEEARKLAVTSRRNLVEIATGIERLRREMGEVGQMLGGPPPDDAGAAEREFEETRGTERIRQDA
jgi:hypothetical protein